jgi:DNA-binding IclR family transcriptional regulator
LREFTRITPQRSVDELAESLHVSRELTLRTLLTLQQHDLIDATSDGSDVYTLGLAWLRLADVRRRQVGMRQVALPVMRRLRDVLNETVILSIRVGSRRVNIDYVESTQAIRRTSQAGFEAPLHIGSAGRVLMSGLNAEELGGYLKSVPLVRFNSEVAVSESAIRSQLDRIRGQGFTVSMREITPDTAAVSAPIHDHTGAVVAALTISCPVDRFTSSLERACITQVTKGADDVSQTLGFTLNL